VNLARRYELARVAGAAERALLLATADARSLGLLRIALGLLLILDLSPRWAEAAAFYSNEGVLTNHFALFRPLSTHQFSAFFGLSSPVEVRVALALTLVFYALFLVGYRTGWFHLLSFVAVTSLHSRNLLVELPSDVPLHLFIGLSLFLPLGRRFSVDSLRHSFAREKERAPEDRGKRPRSAELFVSVAVLGMLLVLSLLHLLPALFPEGDAWRNGTALYDALHQPMWATSLGAWVGEHVDPPILTLGYRAAHALVGCLVLVPLVLARRIAIVALVLLHVGCRVLWDIGPYPWVMLGPTPLLLHTRDWESLRNWYARRKDSLVVYFDVDCGFCFATARLLARIDGLSRLTFASSASEHAPDEVRALSETTASVWVPASGKMYRKSRAFARICRSLPLMAPFGWMLSVPGIPWLADRAYDQFAPRRARVSAWLGQAACGVRRSEISERPSFSRAGGAGLERVLRECAAGLFLLVLGAGAALAIGDDDPPGQGLRAVLAAQVGYPRLLPVAKPALPDASPRQGAMVIEGVTARGLRTDPLGQGAHPNPLWSAYFARISEPRSALYLDGLRDYIRRQDEKNWAFERLVSFTISWIETPIPPPDANLRADMKDALAVRRTLIAHP
jgi:predicted DCC family thiol-disulfide oxidoreductase YuxK